MWLWPFRRKPRASVWADRPPLTGLVAQDGPAERNLTSILANTFAASPTVQRAYLVRSSGVLDDPPRVMLLVHSTVGESAKVIELASAAFRAQFASTQSLDIGFLTADEDCTLRRSCEPFFDRHPSRG